MPQHGAVIGVPILDRYFPNPVNITKVKLAALARSGLPRQRYVEGYANFKKGRSFSVTSTTISLAAPLVNTSHPMSAPAMTTSRRTSASGLSKGVWWWNGRRIAQIPPAIFRSEHGYPPAMEMNDAFSAQHSQERSWCGRGRPLAPGHWVRHKCENSAHLD